MSRDCRVEGPAVAELKYDSRRRGVPARASEQLLLVGNRLINLSLGQLGVDKLNLFPSEPVVGMQEPGYMQFLEVSHTTSKDFG